jgi:hypothetical protein
MAAISVKIEMLFPIDCFDLDRKERKKRAFMFAQSQLYHVIGPGFTWPRSKEAQIHASWNCIVARVF